MYDGKYKEPNRCSCGKTGKFRRLSCDMQDTIKLGIMDNLMEDENKSRAISREKLCILSKDLTSLDIDNKIRPGRNVILNGYLK
jgi:hypothetical protein